MSDDLTREAAPSESDVPARPVSRTDRQIQDDLDQEFAHHLELRAAELEVRGLSPAAAREEALRRFGDLAETRRACHRADRTKERGRRRREHLDEVVQDLKHGQRQLRARPGFTLAAVVTLAIGIGAATAIFGAADHVLLRPLPYRDAERVVTLWESDRATGERTREVSAANFADWKARSTSFEAMGLAEPSGLDLTGGDGPPETLPSWSVTDGFFAALGVSPLIGRTFSAEEYRLGGPRAVMISQGFWQSRFAADPRVVGTTLELDGRASTIVGVLPASLEYPEAKDLWSPKAIHPDELARRTSSYLSAVARLKPGVSPAAARAELDRIAAQLAAEHPRSNANLGVTVIALEDRILGPVRPALLVLLGAVLLMLLIACANLAGLLLARGAERERELAIRAALGADGARLGRQLLTESALLAALGGAAGVLLAWAGTRALVAFGPPELPRLSTLALDARVLAFAAGATGVAALLFGLAPAWRFSRPELRHALASGPRATPSRARARLRAGLVVSEVALALVLLAGAGLLIRSFAELLSNDLGFDPRGRVSVQLFLWDHDPTPAARIQRVAELTTRFRALPGVEDVGLVTALPFHPTQIDAQATMLVHGRPAPPSDAENQVFTTIASGAYFATLGIPLKRGRAFTAADRMDAPRVAIVNEALARRHFPDRDPIGQRVRVGVMEAPEEREIVGVVADVRPTTLDSEARPELFIPYEQSGNGSITFVVRTSRDPAALVPLLREAVWDVSPTQPVYHVATLPELVSATLAERRFHLLLLGAFSTIALVLAVVGLYGLVSTTTLQRTHEFGVRLALGASRRNIATMVVREAVGLIVPGLVIGVVGALLLTRFLGQMLYQVQPGDPVTFAQVTIVMFAVAIAGALAPALRAAFVDPVIALRRE